MTSRILYKHLISSSWLMKLYLQPVFCKRQTGLHTSYSPLPNYLMFNSFKFLDLCNGKIVVDGIALIHIGVLLTYVQAYGPYTSILQNTNCFEYLCNKFTYNL